MRLGLGHFNKVSETGDIRDKDRYRLYLLPDARSSRQDRSESVAMRWLKGSMRFRSRFLFLSKQALLDPVKTADICLLYVCTQSKVKLEFQIALNPK